MRVIEPGIAEEEISHKKAQEAQKEAEEKE